ncbi:MAG: hypothetical protein IKY17_07865 [Oscillospiraceae bacterium]|nr:hypothetical protein [Oscillospiraceae bacterium]
MTEKELKKLSRAELLELLLIQTRETELLRRKLDAAEQEMKNREIRIREAGTLANAAMEINGVLYSAQKAAQQYLDNIARMEQETRFRCQQMLEEAMDEAERIREEAAVCFPEPMKPIVCQSAEPELSDPEPEDPVEAPKEHPEVPSVKEPHWKFQELLRRYGRLK